MMGDLLDHTAMEAAFAARDRAADGCFVVGVLTTGIYCRPSCPARRPKPENTRFYLKEEDAQAAGLRPCRRCRPDEVARDRAAIDRVLALLKRDPSAHGLDALADEVGYSPSHLQRLFKRDIGLSPAAYARALRSQRAQDMLQGASDVTDVIYKAGFESPSRFYAAMEGRLGMTPSVWAKGGEGMTIRWALVKTSLGEMLVAASDKGVCRLAFNTPAEDLVKTFPRATLVPGGDAFTELLGKVIAAVESPSDVSDIPLDVQGTAFQERVWQQLRLIPKGETRSYAELAAAAGNPKAMRAAGSANGANPVAVLIPCHRVIRADGSIGGYAFGTAIKEELLRREKGES
ncbi:bifunctional transcriptional activator/DNA repair enzyme AdaA [Altericroceibacterium indicum]